MHTNSQVQSIQSTRSQRLAAIGHCLLERLETPLFVTDADGADGGGDGLSASVYLARDGRMELLASTPVGHSLGNV